MRRSRGNSVGSAEVTSVDDGSSDSAFNLPRIVDTFNRHGIAYLAIGGVSGFLHGMVEYVTQDVDMMVKSSKENLQLILGALAELGASIPSGTETDDLDGQHSVDHAERSDRHSGYGPRAKGDGDHVQRPRSLCRSNRNRERSAREDRLA